MAWFQEEQNGPAKRTWLAIWDTMQDIDQQQLAANGNNTNSTSTTATTTTTITTTNSGSDGSNPKTAKEMNILLDRGNNQNHSNNSSSASERSTYYNPSRRKPGMTQQETNRASTFNMNKYQARLVGKHGGCPWRPANYKYGRGVLG